VSRSRPTQLVLLAALGALAFGIAGTFVAVDVLRSVLGG
jgi:hypothetical protein